MISDFLRRSTDAGNPESYAARFRHRRFELFKSLMYTLPKPLSIIDIGGTQLFWERMGFTGDAETEITILNVSETRVTLPNFKSVIGDARDINEFSDKEFDVVFSNSVIEHVGNFAQQQLMAKECLRIGKRLFLQTPNRFFPIEPHFLLPFIQFVPLWLKVFLTRHFRVGWYAKLPDKKKAYERMSSVRLLTRSELQRLFPEGAINEERVFGLTKSFIVSAGWDGTLTARVSTCPRCH